MEERKQPTEPQGKASPGPGGDLAVQAAGTLGPLEAGYQALRAGAGAFEFGRDFVRVAGPDAEKYLQGQLSQDIAAISVGGWAWSLVLQPQGKLVALVRVYRPATTEFLLDTDAGAGPALLERLARFKLRTKADVEPLAWRAVAVRGPEASMAGPPRSHLPPGTAPAPSGPNLAVPFRWDGLVGYDLIGPAPPWPASVLAVPSAAYEAVRVEAGFPRQGAELDERTIPAEAGLVDAAVSFTKGCYTGQELVARIDARGSNVPRRLRGFLLRGRAEPGADLFADPSGAGKPLGRLTSVAFSPDLGWVALGYAARGVEPGQVAYLDGGVTAEARALPLVS